MAWRILAALKRQPLPFTIVWRTPPRPSCQPPALFGIKAHQYQNPPRTKALLSATSQTQSESKHPNMSLFTQYKNWQDRENSLWIKRILYFQGCLELNSEIHKFGIQFQQFLSSFDQQSARDIDTRVPSSFKCTFTLLIFRPHSPSFSFFAKLLLTWLEMKKCNFQEEGKSPRLPAQWLVPISAAVLHDLTLSPSQAVQVLYLHKKKEAKCSYFFYICNRA